MVGTSDILTIISLVVATILGLGAIWATRRYNNTARVRDIEMGLLRSQHESEADEHEVDASPQIPPLGIAEQRHNLHEVIGDALELFSRHLRGHN
ncbi:hypothetical protein NA56DRAFT_750631 [Hyaloscypha hepaticicola]|uniref:Uncharacterized protein n=1 Tax=Hyaloscypha hepaticicola TaxID=2082293 RepID=A0A2J6PZU3_9HELO|nr:hypothetical protein NA56DRAFT_750631 [Hyaloscypha hepaticicola]